MGAKLAYSESASSERGTTDTDLTSTATNTGRGFEASAIFGAMGFKLSTGLAHTFSHEWSKSAEKTSGSTSARSFELGDGDKGDYFDVQVFFIISY
jgi:hypothetical protein